MKFNRIIDITLIVFIIFCFSFTTVFVHIASATTNSEKNSRTSSLSSKLPSAANNKSNNNEKLVFSYKKANNPIVDEFVRKIQYWNTEFNSFQALIESKKSISDRKMELLKTKISKIRADAFLMKEKIKEDVKQFNSLLGTLGASGASDTSDSSAKEKGAKALDLSDANDQGIFYTKSINDFSHINNNLKNLIIRGDAILFMLARRAQSKVYDSLLRESPKPFSYRTWSYALTDLHEQMHIIFSSVLSFIKMLDMRNIYRGFSLSQVIPYLLAFAFTISVFSAILFVRKKFNSIFKKNNTLALLVAQTMQIAIKVMVPIAILFLFLLPFRFLASFALNGVVESLIDSILVFLSIFLSVIFIPEILWAPSRGIRFGNLKQLKTDFSSEVDSFYGERLAARVKWFGFFISFDIVVAIINRSLIRQESILTLEKFFFSCVEGFLISAIVKPSFWRDHKIFKNEKPKNDKTDPVYDDTSGENHQNKSSKEIINLSVRYRQELLYFVLISTIIFSIFSEIFGYVELGYFFIHSISLTILAIGATFFLQVLISKWIEETLKSNLTRKWIAFTSQTENVVQLWIAILLNILLFATCMIVIGVIWGLRVTDMWLFTQNFLNGFRVGGAVISIRDILIGIGFFILFLLMVRISRRILEEKILPKLTNDPGVRYSISTIFGYTGIVVSILAAATLMGVNLQTVLVIAGGLSLGIGLGLQNIANNFISGIILLFERPIKIGDIVQIGDIMGTVTRIKVRATEVMTFQKSEVLIPNAQLISDPVTNWTHNSRQARIEIAINVAYGSNTTLVRDVLLKVVTSNSHLLKRPAPEVVFLDFAESSLAFSLRCYTSDVALRLSLASQIRFDIDKAFRDNGISMPFPHRHLVLDPSIYPLLGIVKTDTNQKPTRNMRSSDSNPGTDTDTEIATTTKPSS